MSVVFLLLAIILFLLWRKSSKESASLKEENGKLTQTLDDSEKKAKDLESQLSASNAENSALNDKVNLLSQYQGLVDVDAEIQKKRTDAEAELQSMRDSAAQDISAAKEEAKERLSLIHI